MLISSLQAKYCPWHLLSLHTTQPSSHLVSSQITSSLIVSLVKFNGISPDTFSSTNTDSLEIFSPADADSLDTFSSAGTAIARVINIRNAAKQNDFLLIFRFIDKAIFSILINFSFSALNYFHLNSRAGL